MTSNASNFVITTAELGVNVGMKYKHLNMPFIEIYF
jgi:hypothetical protein